MDLKNMSVKQIIKELNLCDLDYTVKFNDDLDANIGTIYDDGTNTIDLYWSYDFSVDGVASGEIDIEPIPSSIHKYDPFEDENMNYDGMFDDNGYELWSIGKVAPRTPPYDNIDFYTSHSIDKSDGIKKLNDFLSEMNNPSLDDFYIVVFNSYEFPIDIGFSKVSDGDKYEMKVLESFIASDMFVSLDTTGDFTDESYWQGLFKNYSNDFWNLGFYIVHTTDGKPITKSEKKYLDKLMQKFVKQENYYYDLALGIVVNNDLNKAIVVPVFRYNDIIKNKGEISIDDCKIIATYIPDAEQKYFK